MNWENYDKKFYAEPNDIIEQENKCLKSIIVNANIENKRCLDIGCGSGYWISHVLRKNAHVVGVDLSFDGLKKCFALHPSDCVFVLSRGEVLPFSDSQFDVIMTNWILQEFYEHDKFIKLIDEIHRILKVNGKFIVAENIYPDKRILHESTDIGDIFESQNNPSLLRFFSNNTLLKIVDKFGFRQIVHRKAGDSFFEVYECKS